MAVGFECLEIHVPALPLDRLVCRTTKLIYVERGGGRCRVGRQVYDVQQGDLLIIPPGEVHGGTTPAPGTRLHVLITPPDNDRSAALATPGIERTPVVSDPNASRQFRGLFAAMRNGSGPLEVESRLEAFRRLGRAGADPSQARFSRGSLRLVRDKIADRCDEDLTLAELAAECGLSPSQLCRAFAREFGTTPHAYQLAMRAERSRRLIGEGMGLSEAAVQVGFYDQAHLNRHFRQIFGTSPGRYATAHRGGAGDGVTRNFVQDRSTSLALNSVHESDVLSLIPENQRP